MKKILKPMILGSTLLALAGGVSAQVVGKMEDQIRWRQAAYHTMAWSMARIKTNVEGQYNKDQVLEAATLIQALANSKMGALYQPGSDKGKGFKETRLKPEFFTDKENLGKVATAFSNEANEMAKVAATGDAKMIGAQFAKLGDACKGCHDKFRKED